MDSRTKGRSGPLIFHNGSNEQVLLFISREFFYLSLKESLYGVLHLLLQTDQLQKRIYVAKTFLEQGPLTGLPEI